MRIWVSLFIGKFFLTSIYEGRLVVKFLGTTIDKNNLYQTILDLPEDTNDSKKNTFNHTIGH